MKKTFESRKQKILEKKIKKLENWFSKGKPHKFVMQQKKTTELLLQTKIW